MDQEYPYNENHDGNTEFENENIDENYQNFLSKLIKIPPPIIVCLLKNYPSAKERLQRIGVHDLDFQIFINMSFDEAKGFADLLEKSTTSTINRILESCKKNSYFQQQLQWIERVEDKNLFIFKTIARLPTNIRKICSDEYQVEFYNLVLKNISFDDLVNLEVGKLRTVCQHDTRILTFFAEKEISYKKIFSLTSKRIQQLCSKIEYRDNIDNILKKEFPELFSNSIEDEEKVSSKKNNLPEFLSEESKKKVPSGYKISGKSLCCLSWLSLSTSGISLSGGIYCYASKNTPFPNLSPYDWIGLLSIAYILMEMSYLTQSSKQDKQTCYSSKCIVSTLSGISAIAGGAVFYFKNDAISVALLIFASGIVLFGKLLECAAKPQSIKMNEHNFALDNESEKSDNSYNYT